MGHFYSKNFSETTIELFEQVGETDEDNYVTIQMVVDALKSKGETLHAAEGEYTEDYMLSMGAETLFFGYQMHCNCIMPDPRNEEQETIIKRYEHNIEDFEEEDYAMLDSVPWIRVHYEGRDKPEEIPVIDYIPT